VVEDIGVDAIKIGMLHAPGIVEVVAWAIDHYQLKNVVLDPVMVATSGDRLIANETVQVLVRELFPRVSVITPNLDEAALLLAHEIPNAASLDAAAQDLLAMGANAVAQRRALGGR
jgi:hydroxymethylpyrimidine/phosphomethylpyrimidine kinase